MLRRVVTFFCVMMVAQVGLAVEQPTDSEYLSGQSGKGLILCHGKGKHPTWLVVNPLRKEVNEDLDFSTLSLQMPNEDKHWKEYTEDFRQAYDTISQGIAYLQAQGVKDVYLMGHSMGARMASSYVAEHPDSELKGLIVAGCRNNGGEQLSCEQNLQNVTIPVLDIWGDNNGKDRRAASEREGLVSDTYQQVAIDDANHKFEDTEDELVEAVEDWLKQR